MSSKLFLKIILIVCTFIAVERFCHKKTYGFRVCKILSHLSPNPLWDVSLAAEELKEVQVALNQPYRFLAKGGQCYAFVSEDEQYVLKFFKHHHMRTFPFLQKIPLPSFLHSLRTKWIQGKQESLYTIFNSFKVAFERFKEETALLYLHLNKTQGTHSPITLIDALGISHQLDLDKLEFALQKKVTLAYPTLERLMQEGQLESAKACLESMIDLIVKRCQMGLSDKDPIVKRNFGFIGEKAIELDLGSFSVNESIKSSSASKKILAIETLKLRRWISKKYPLLSPFLEEKIQDRLLRDFDASLSYPFFDRKVVSYL